LKVQRESNTKLTFHVKRNIKSLSDTDNTSYNF